MYKAVRYELLETANPPGESSWKMAFIVQGKPRVPEGIVKVVAETRTEALQAARDLLDRGMVVVTVIGDGRVYTVDEFALTFINQAE
jgi:hypothetical protein